MSTTASSPAPLAQAAESLFLIDTMGYIFRAYHALPPLTNSKGMRTHAVLGFTNMLRKLLVDVQPGYIAAVMDTSGPTFRDEAYAAYKANRTAMPEDLAAQLPYIRRVLEAFRVPILEYQGFEADDVIGTLARQSAERQHAAVIVSSDKDMLQLVNDHVCVLNPTKGDLLCDAQKVEEITGVQPSQIADLLALLGDSIDNIPGAPGIGKVGARDLIQRFGSVEAALEHAAEVEGKRYRESLQNNREQILLSKQLATIDTHAPVDLDLDQLRRRQPDLQLCQVLFRELEFSTILKSLLASHGETEPTPEAELFTAKVECDERSASPTELLAMLRGAAEVAIIASQNGFSAAISGGEGKPAIAVSLAAAQAPEFVPLLLNEISHGKQRWIVCDLKGFMRALLPFATAAQVEAAVEAAVQQRRWHDLQLCSYLLEPTQSSHELAALWQRRLGCAAAQSPAEEAAGLLQLAGPLTLDGEHSGLRRAYDELDLPLIPVLLSLEETGVLVNPSELGAMSHELEQQAAALERQIQEAAGEVFNVNSPQQLARILFEKLGLPQPQKRGKSKAPSTAVDILEELAPAYPIAGQVLEYRQLSKLKSTYVDVLPQLIRPATGRLHTTFSQVTTATGRLSSNSPNLQNIPIRTEAGRRIRAAFCAPPGSVLLAADYSQIELRLLAHFSQDTLLLAAFQKGLDIHRLTAAEVFGVPPMMITDEHRRRAKAVNFGIVYGLSAFGLSRQLGIPQSEAASFIKRYFERYSGVQAYLQETLRQARERGAVETLFGRVRPLPDINSRNAALRGFAERTAVNTPLQGTAADLMKLAMIRIHHKLRGTPARMLLQVHDELVFETPRTFAAELAPLVQREMEQVYQLSVPLTVDVSVGPNWRDTEEWKPS